MCCYLSKEVNECSKTMKQATKESLGSGTGNYMQIKYLTYTYASKQESSLKECNAVSHVSCIMQCQNCGLGRFLRGSFMRIEKFLKSVLE